MDTHYNKKIACTYLVSYEGRLVGYFTLQTDAINLDEAESAEFRDAGMPYRTFPAIKIGRFGIDKRYQRQNVGTTALHVIIGIALNICEKAAAGS